MKKRTVEDLAKYLHDNFCKTPHAMEWCFGVDTEWRAKALKLLNFLGNNIAK